MSLTKSSFYDANGLPYWVKHRVRDNHWPIEVCEQPCNRLSNGHKGFRRAVISPKIHLPVHVLETMVRWGVLEKREIARLTDGRRHWLYSPTHPIEWSHWEI